MGDDLILEFTTYAEAETALHIINAVASAWWLSQGYTVINNELVPKNLDGTDNLSAQRTTAWDVIKESPDGTFYFSSPTADPRFYAWRDYLPDGVSIPADKPFPDAWLPPSA